METKTYDLNSYKLHLIKSNKSKTCHMEIHFRSEVSKNIMYKSFLCDVLTDCSKKYQTRKDVVIRMEELSKASFYGTTSKTGAVINTMFVYNFINPKYINDDNYLEEVLELPFEMLLKPKVTNKEFDSNIVNVVKERLKKDVKAVNENPTKLSISNALKIMDKDSLSSVSVLGEIEDIDNVTPASLYEEYENMINNDYCDIFLIGNIDFDKVHKIITKKFKLNTIKTKELELYVPNKLTKKTKVESDISPFVQSNLNVVFNLDNLTKDERNIDIQVFNYLFGSGGLSSKLYKKLREEHSLCYGVYSIFLKYDNLIIINVGLDESNREKALELIKEAFNEMLKGDISDNDLEDAKLNLYLSLEMTLDNNIAILNNHVFNVYDNLPLVEERMNMIKKLTKDNIMNVAKKIKYNTIYTLKSEVTSEKN